MRQGVNRIYFREEQSFRQLWLWALLLSILALFVYGVVTQVVMGKTWGNRPAGDAELLVVTALLVVVNVWIYNMRLVTEVRDDGLHYHFRLLWRRKKIAYQQIRDARVRTYNPITEYGGWGIRLGARGWAYNVSGNRGVELQLVGDKELLIGSQRPEELARAIRERMNAAT